ncbi:DUF1357 family protein [Borrelia miyamotoi]|uniref:DUF1357 family protein n=1 Tax=Borrelia miyamotoi TaxID=47466 RepID=A0AAQ2WXR8_9SPIR|nr:DUF1357 family protein [Borrelia miyamotoi]AOW96140.1 hypothetical protein AXH25_05540 [Borrelia miyamotoi]QTL84189.1 DUF1357 family protein [Borrelia miyamotoi]QTL84227.1 DUF1357 family protein [Borrelia miyamotoi]WAZ85837.1 DUF1357 family protein [Borrelia miyamotoi]WAZ85875.1 DUF1357 family protein [Borrelia miyamotoi]
MIQEIQENLDRTQESQDTTNTNTEELRNTQESVNLNLKDYEEYRVYKAEKEKEHINKNLSINERISRELAEAQAREEQEQKLLLEATRINEIDNLARKHLSSHFNKESLLSKGYSLKDIMQAQRRELVRKYVPIDDIYAISKVRDTQHLDGKVLEQLVNLAKVNIKKRIQATKITSKGDVKFSLSNEVLSILDPNFTPHNFNEFNISIVNAYKSIREQFYNLKTKKSA